MPLTLRQREVLDFIRGMELQRGVAPTTREIQHHFGFASQTAAVDHIRALKRLGVLNQIPGKARAITASPPKVEIVHVPIFGTVPAGIPELVEQRPDGYIPVNIAAIGVSRHETLFATGVRGDSMIDAHILDGDTAVFAVRRPQYGKIVAALIDGETTLKRYVQKRGRVYLHAENPLFSDLIPARELIIQGVLVHLQRNL